MDPRRVRLRVWYPGAEATETAPSDGERDKREKFLRTAVERSGGKDCERRIWGSVPAPQPPGLQDLQAGNAGARPTGKVEKSEGQTILRAVVNDEAFVTSAADGQIGGALGALRVVDDLLTEGIKGCGRTGGLQSVLDVGGFDLAAWW